MIKYKVKTNLPQLTKLQKSLVGTRLSSTLFKTGEWTKANIIKNWNNSKGASGDSLAPLSPAYKEAKTGDGVLVDGARRKGQGKPDFLLTGSLQRALFTSPKGLKSVLLTFRAAEIPKAKGNAANRPNIMDVDKKFAGRIRDAFRRIITK